MAKIFYKDKPIIGLDISPTGIKVMSIDTRKWLVNGYASADLDPILVQQCFDNPDNTYLKDNIVLLLKEKVVGSLESNHVAISVPTSRTFSRTFTIPRDQEKFLEDAISLEVNQYIPIAPDLLYVDHEIIEKNKKSITVLLCAIPKQIVDDATEAAWSAGLRPVLVEPSIHSVARLLKMTEHGQLSTLIIDIGQLSTDIAVLYNGNIRITGGLGVGGNHFTEAIANNLDVSLENAYQLKVINGLNSGHRQADIKNALDKHLHKIINECEKVIRYYIERLEAAEKIEQVILVGSGSSLPGIGEYFTEQLEMPARTASPWQQFDFNDLPQPHKQFRPRYITVAGLSSIKKEEILR